MKRFMYAIFPNANIHCIFAADTDAAEKKRVIQLEGIETVVILKRQEKKIEIFFRYANHFR